MPIGISKTMYEQVGAKVMDHMFGGGFYTSQVEVLKVSIQDSLKVKKKMISV